MHAHYVLTCTGLYLSQIWSIQRDQIIYGIRRTRQTSLSTKSFPSTQACMHACYVPVCTGPYLSQFWLSQRDQSIYWIRITCRTFLSISVTPSTLASMHEHYVLACTGSYFWQIGLDWRIKISMELGKHVRHIWAHNMTQAHKLACICAIFLHA